MGRRGALSGGWPAGAAGRGAAGRGRPGAPAGSPKGKLRFEDTRAGLGLRLDCTSDWCEVTFEGADACAIEHRVVSGAEAPGLVSHGTRLNKKQLDRTRVVIAAEFALLARERSPTLVIRKGTLGNVTVELTGGADVACFESLGRVPGDLGNERRYQIPRLGRQRPPPPRGRASLPCPA